MNFRKLFYAAILVIGISGSANAQATQEGNMIIDASLGFPNLFSAIVKSAYDAASYSNVKVKSVGPFCGAAEYLVSDKIGLGAEFTYANTIANFNYFDGNSIYQYEYSYIRWRLLPRVNIHFAANEKVDPYLAVGMGYGNFKGKVISTNDPTADGAAEVKNPLSFSYRIGFGVRYFFVPNFGIHSEFGIGGPLAKIGLSVKF